MGLKDLPSAPLGGTRRYLVRMDGSPWNSFDSRDEADRHVAMQKSKWNANKSQPAAAATKSWTIEDRGVRV